MIRDGIDWNEDVRTLALQGVQQEVLQQIAGWQIAREKLPLWAACSEVQYAPRVNMEQCSSEATARFKALLVCELLSERTALCDLTGGFGVDFTFLAPHFNRAIYIDCNPELAATAMHNAEVLGVENARFIEGDGAAMLESMPSQTLIFVDPSRRDTTGRRVYLLGDCTPNVVQLRTLLLQRSRMVMLKLSPMLDIHEAVRQLPHTCTIYVVSVHGDVKELLLIMRRSNALSPQIMAVNLTRDGAVESRFAFTIDEEIKAQPIMAEAIGQYLYEPAPALMKAGAFKTLAVRYGMKKIDNDTHLYTSTELIRDFPGRTLAVEAVSDIRHWRRDFQELNQLNIVCRNFPGKPEDLQRRLKIRDGGDRFLYAMTMGSKRPLVLCRQLIM